MKRPWWLAVGGLALVLVLASLLRPSPAPRSIPKAAVQQLPEAVSALGRLEPAGDVRKLAAPMSGLGGSPRIAALLVQEGDRVRRGDLLASFDSRPGLLADQALVQTKISNTLLALQLLERDTRRYRRLAKSGATPSADLDNREIRLISLRGDLAQARVQLRKVQSDLVQSELRSPIDATVLRILARPGERPGDSGILELGNTDQMEAVAEVYESDINRVRVGQPATLISENGGLTTTLKARVLRITPQVRQRQVVSTNPTGDADARVVEVRLALDPSDLARVRQLAGLKVIIRFLP
jgi:HlyD family secretion protein